MTHFGLEPDLIQRLIVGVSDADPIADGSVEARFAGAAWSGLVEPGDGTAGALVAALGPARALDALVSDWSANRIRDAVREVDRVEADSIEQELAPALARWRPRLKSADVVHSIEQAARVGAALVVRGDTGWPSQVEDLGRHAPMVLWRRGSAAVCINAARSFAIVGARAATTYGEQVTMDASAELVGRGFAIVSGAAYGIDGMAHGAALANEGQTVAILAGGVDRFYPSGHDALLRKIAQYGAVISEVPCGAAPTKWRFLQRNRLIAAVSSATVVVEAGHRSGSLNTAAHASALGRPLGAVPGPVTSPASAGCHRLIRDYDAICVTNPDEMVQLLGEVAGDSAPIDSQRSAEQTRVIDALSTRSPRPVEAVAALAGLSVMAAGSVLGSLELDGTVVEHERGWLRV
jgi:DNA processing protein